MSVARVRAVLAALSFLFALPACSSSDDEPSADASPEISVPSSNTSTTPEPKPETAKQFIRRYEAVIEDMQNTGDTKEYRAMTRGCSECRQLEKTVREIYANDGSIKFEGARITGMQRSGGSTRQPIYRVTLQAGSTTIKESPNAQEQSLKGGQSIFQWTLRRTPKGWLIADSGELPS